MTVDLVESLLTQRAFFLVIGFVLLYLGVGWVIQKRERKGKPVVAPRIMRYLLLPTVFVYLVCVYLFFLSRDHVSVKLTETIIIIFAIVFTLNVVSHLFFSPENIITKKETLPKLGRDMIKFLLVVIGSAFVFSSIWGLDLGNLLTALGVGSFVIGLALQEPLGNLFNGVALLVAKPFERGDWVVIGHDTGKVVEFNWRSAKLINRFNELIIIPNNLLAKERIKNLSRPSRIHAEMITVGFSYDDDPKKVKSMLLEVSRQTENILENPQSSAVTLSYDDFYVNYGLKFFINDFEDQIVLKDSIMTKIYEATQQYGLTIPFPVQKILLDKN